MRFVTDTIIAIVIAFTLFFVYQNYWDDILFVLFDAEPEYTVYIDTLAISVTIADEHEERVRGLSGVDELKELEGKLFIFEEEAKHGIWMKDMQFPIDIIWLDNAMKVVDTITQVSPESYPTVFAPQRDARFVLEVNAFFVDTYKIAVGDTITLPPSILPVDIRESLQK